MRGHVAHSRCCWRTRRRASVHHGVAFDRVTPSIGAIATVLAEIDGRRRRRSQDAHEHHPSSSHDRRQGRARPGGRRRTRGRAVHDQHRHGRHRRHGGADRGARHGGLGDRARHGQRPRGGRRRPRDQAPAARRGLHRADRRRLPLQRSPAADALSRLRGSPRQVPHQPGQRRARACGATSSSR